MVKIVTGNINSGKTTSIHSIFKDNQLGDGFIQLKTMQNMQVHHYDVLHLKSNQKKVIAIHQDFYNNQFKKPIYFGPYIFDEVVFDEISKVIDEMIKQGTNPIYLDEIGMLEMNQKGYAIILKKLIESNIDLIIVVKQSLIMEVVKTFDIQNYEIIGDTYV